MTTLAAGRNISTFIPPLPDEPVCKHVAKRVNSLLACGRKWKGRVKNRGGRKELSGIKMIYCKRLTTCAADLSPPPADPVVIAGHCLCVYSHHFALPLKKEVKQKCDLYLNKLSCCPNDPCREKKLNIPTAPPGGMIQNSLRYPDSPG